MVTTSNVTRWSGWTASWMRSLGKRITYWELGADDILVWINSHPTETDATVCDCCGDGSSWYGERGCHDSKDCGPGGPYAYNGGLPECS